MERVADEAGVTRGLVRHYLGNRDEAVRAVMTHVRELYIEAIQASLAAEGDKVELLLEGLFGDGVPTELDWVVDTLFVAATRDAQIAEMLRSFYLELENTVDAALAEALPSADKRARKEVAFAVLSIAAMVSDFEAIGLPASRRRAARAAAGRLIDTLR
jgi:AcrR family transcriptional regulator